MPFSDAGRYLCEFVYFKSLHSVDRKALFIHVPMSDVFPADKCAEAIKYIADYIMKSSEIEDFGGSGNNSAV